MNPFDALQIPSFIPDLSNAKRVTFKSPEDIKNDELAKLEKEQIKQQIRSNHAYRMRLSRWRKEREKALKRVTRCQWFLNEAQTYLKGVEDAKPLPPVVGNSDNRLLESLDVEQEKEVFSAA